MVAVFSLLRSALSETRQLVDSGSNAGDDGPADLDTELYHCSSCGTVYIATEKNRCSSCRESVEQVSSTLSCRGDEGARDADEEDDRAATELTTDR